MLNSRDIGGVGAVQVAIGVTFFIQFDQVASLEHVQDQGLVFCLAAIAPVDTFRTGDSGHFIDPLLESFIVCRHWVPQTESFCQFLSGCRRWDSVLYIPAIAGQPQALFAVDIVAGTLINQCETARY
jgi:hypothetical protein